MCAFCASDSARAPTRMSPTAPRALGQRPMAGLQPNHLALKPIGLLGQRTQGGRARRVEGRRLGAHSTSRNSSLGSNVGLNTVLIAPCAAGASKRSYMSVARGGRAAAGVGAKSGCPDGVRAAGSPPAERPRSGEGDLGPRLFPPPDGGWDPPLGAAMAD